jgi:Ca2+-binding EF-hand superfamily protein
MKAAQVKNMVVCVSQVNSSDENLVQGDGKGNDFESETDKLRTEEQKMKLRLLQSAAMVPPEAAAKARPLDMAFVNSRIEKLQEAVNNGPEWEARFKEITGKTLKKKRVAFTQAAKDILEKKLADAIKEEYEARSKMLAKEVDRELIKKSLTTRVLLPFYKLHDVKHFMDIFAKVDEDFSGDLDMDEWCKLFSTLNQNITNNDARMIFLKIDQNNDGFLSMSDLIPVVFSKATKEQQKLILAYAETEIIRKHSGMTTINIVELEQLFVTYDVNNVGFVEVSLIRERIRAMNLPEAVQFSFMDSILEIADDDMLSLVEFMRVFKLYISKDIVKKKS